MADQDLERLRRIIDSVLNTDEKTTPLNEKTCEEAIRLIQGANEMIKKQEPIMDDLIRLKANYIPLAYACALEEQDAAFKREYPALSDAVENAHKHKETADKFRELEKEIDFIRKMAPELLRRRMQGMRI